MLVFLMMRPWSIFCPMPWTTNTMWVVSGGVSSGAASSTQPRWRRVPLLEAEDVSYIRQLQLRQLHSIK